MRDLRRLQLLGQVREGEGGMGRRRGEEGTGASVQAFA